MPKTPRTKRDKMKKTNIKNRKLSLRKPTQISSPFQGHKSTYLKTVNGHTEI